VLAPEHPLVDLLTTDEQRDQVTTYKRQAANQDLVSRKVSKEKTGVFTGSFALNPATQKPIPIWIADYVLMEYGTGAIMAVPGHDERDFEFAKAFDLAIVRVVAPGGGADGASLHAPFTETANAHLVNSGQFSSLDITEGSQKIVEWLSAHGHARGVVNYRLHDWCISRQRYWGRRFRSSAKCGTVPARKGSSRRAPYVEDFKPTTLVSPLARVESWYRVNCPTCGGSARRETDVSDTFLDSAWYFLRYPSTDFSDVPFDRTMTDKWLPVTSYIGGNEHAVLHLLYSRFVTMVLQDAGHIDFEEPYKRFRAHGHIIRDGAKMSKSRGNVVNPDEYVERWGAERSVPHVLDRTRRAATSATRASPFAGFWPPGRARRRRRGATSSGAAHPAVMQASHQRSRKCLC
jgi:leucyl-tRNA synthetase